jgi:DNA-binding IscR family transcriptional regulator
VPVASRKRRRSRKGGKRSDHALAFIVKNPGSTATQVAEKLRVKPNYMYRVLGDLAKDGKVKKEGTAYWPSA